MNAKTSGGTQPRNSKTGTAEEAAAPLDPCAHSSAKCDVAREEPDGAEHGPARAVASRARSPT